MAPLSAENVSQKVLPCLADPRVPWHTLSLRNDCPGCEIERLRNELEHRERYAAQMNDILQENARLRIVVRRAHQERDARSGLAPCSCIDCHPAGSSLTSQ